MSQTPNHAETLAAAYDAEHFRQQGHALIDTLADYLAATSRGEGSPVVLPSPRQETARWQERLAAPFSDLNALTREMLGAAVHQHHPGYVGHQVSAPLPEMALCELTAALLNNGMAVYESGPLSTALERIGVRWLCEQAGFGPQSGGVLTSGGSLGNLTALLAARQARAGGNPWVEGNPQHLAILTSTEAHYCVGRSARIMGLGDQGVIAAPVDDRFRLRASALAAAYEQAQAQGKRIFAVVACAGSTSTGAIDPLDEIADFCHAKGLWLHVDGAHGASLVLSAEHREALRGLSRADSLVWDLHKMMMAPSITTAVLYQRESEGYGAFAQQAPYLFPGDDAPDANIGLRTLECTKRMMSLKLYATLALHGPALFAGYVSRVMQLRSAFVEMLRARSVFRLAVEPDLNIVCFRYQPSGVADLNALQDELRQRVIARGRFYLVRTQLRGEVFLRVTLTNPLTREEDLSALLDEIEAAHHDANRDS